MSAPIICFGQQPCGFFPKRFLFAKIVTARRLQREIGGEGRIGHVVPRWLVPPPDHVAAAARQRNASYGRMQELDNTLWISRQAMTSGRPDPVLFSARRARSSPA